MVAVTARWPSLRRSAALVSVVIGACLIAPSVSLAAVPPPNDNYLASTIIPGASTTRETASFQNVENTTAATTQSDLFNPEANGMPFHGGGPEPLNCNGVTYGNTIWYDMHPKLDGGVELDAAGFGTVIALYEWNTHTALITRRIGCQVSRSLENDYPVPVDLQKGDAYTVQIGGISTPTGFQAGTLDFKMSWFTDRDGDGIFDVLDKCPTLPGVSRYGGCPPTINPLPRYADDSTGSAVKMTLLRLDQIPGGSQVTARCAKCGVRQRVTVGAHATSATMSGFDGKTLSDGDTLEIFVTKGRSGHGDYRYGAIGSYISYSVHSGSLTNRVVLCLMPGSTKPQHSCPPGGRRKVPSHDVHSSMVPGAAWRRIIAMRGRAGYG